MAKLFRGAPWTHGDMEMRILEGQPPEGFDCGNDAYNRFLYTRAWRDQKRGVTVTHLLRIKGIAAAYVTLTMDRIRLGPREKPKGVTWQLIGALKIARLAVARPFAGHGLGAYVVGYVVEYARALRGSIGCRYVTLDAERELVAWYEAKGFVANKEEQGYREQLAQERSAPPDALAQSMRFDLREAGTAD